MRKIQLSLLLMILTIFMLGCENKAVSMQNEGVWEERQKNWTISENKGWKLELSISVNGAMTEEDRLEVLDYYAENMTENTPFDPKQEPIDGCYVLFYQGDTDEVIQEIKYCDGEIIELAKEDKEYFESRKFKEKGSASKDDE